MRWATFARAHTVGKAAALLALAVGIIACGVDETADIGKARAPDERSSSTTDAVTAESPSTEPITATAASSAASPLTAAPPHATTPPDPPPPELVGGCVDLTNWHVLAGGAIDQVLATAAANGEAALADACVDLARAEPERAAAMVDEMAQVKRFLEEASRPTTTPPTTAAPTPPVTRPAVDLPPPANECDPNYAGACVPIASDVDCAGGSGNGPAYVQGPVRVVGRDIYDLDGNDNDGIGCE